MTTADPTVRRVYAACVRSPRAAFIAPYLTRPAANRRVRIARARGWTAALIECDLVAVDGETSLDPLDLDEPDALDEVDPPRRSRRRGRRGARARLLDDEQAAATGAEDAVDLDAVLAQDNHHDDDREEFARA